MRGPHDPAACPKCGRQNIPVFELAVPAGLEGREQGALHLAVHDCPSGGDFLCLQPGTTRPELARVTFEEIFAAALDRAKTSSPTPPNTQPSCANGGESKPEVTR